MNAVHRMLHQAPESEWALAADCLNIELHAVQDCHRCDCGGWWVWVADDEGMTARWHVAPLGQGRRAL